MPTTHRDRGRVLGLAAVCSALTLALGLVPGSASAEPSPTIAQAKQRIEGLTHQAEQAAERYNAARERLKTVRQRLDTVRGRLSDQEQAVAEMQQAIGQLAAASYRSGSMGATLQLLLADDPTSFLQQAMALDQLGRSQSAKIRRMSAAQLRLEATKATVKQQREKAAGLTDRLATEKNNIENRTARAEAVLATLEAQQRRRLERAEQAAAQRVQETAQRASRSASRSVTSAGSTYDGAASGRAAVAVQTAYAQLGDAYVYGAAGPSAFDCSGLTMYAWRAAGVSLPHSSSMQYSSGRKVSRSDLQPGDLVFYYSPISHVGMYVGGGKLIHASRPGQPVHIVGVDTMPYVGAVRP